MQVSSHSAKHQQRARIIVGFPPSDYQADEGLHSVVRLSVPCNYDSLKIGMTYVETSTLLDT